MIAKDLKKEPKSDAATEGSLSGQEVTHDDHPLSQGTNSAWKAYFKDSEILEQIERDVRRTHPDMHFFNSEASLQPNGAGDLNDNQIAMRRALFVYAKLNPGIWCASNFHHHVHSRRSRCSLDAFNLILSPGMSRE